MEAGHGPIRTRPERNLSGSGSLGGSSQYYSSSHLMQRGDPVHNSDSDRWAAPVSTSHRFCSGVKDGSGIGAWWPEAGPEAERHSGTGSKRMAGCPRSRALMQRGDPVRRKLLPPATDAGTRTPTANGHGGQQCRAGPIGPVRENRLRQFLFVVPCSELHGRAVIGVLFGVPPWTSCSELRGPELRGVPPLRSPHPRIRAARQSITTRRTAAGQQ